MEIAEVSLQSRLQPSSLPATCHMSQYHTQLQTEALEAKQEVLYVQWSRAQSLPNVKQEVQQRLGRDSKPLFFLLNGRLAEEDWTSGMRAFRSIKVGESVTTSTLTLHITHKQQCHLVTVDPNNTVKTLKVKLQEITQVPIPEQVLMRCNRVLSDTHMLKRYALMSGHVLSLCCKSEITFCTVVIKPVRGEDPLYTLKVEIDHNTTVESLSKHICQDLGGFPLTGKIFLKGKEEALHDTAILHPTELELLYHTEYALGRFQVDGVLPEHERLMQSPLSQLIQEVSSQQHPALLAQSDGRILIQNNRPLCFMPRHLYLKVPTSHRYCLVKHLTPNLATLVEGCDSLLHLQTQLEQVGFPLREQILIYNEKFVSEEVLNSLELRENCCLQLVMLKDVVSLFIYKTANLWLYLELPYGSLIGELKLLIQQLEGIPVAEQILLYKKTEVNDSLTLPECGLLPGSSLLLLRVLRGTQGPLRVITRENVKVRVTHIGWVWLEQVLHTEKQVGDLLSQFERDMGVERDRLALFHEGMKLEPETLLEDKAQDDTVELELKEYRIVTFTLLNKSVVSLQEAITTCMPMSHIIDQLSASLQSSIFLYRLGASLIPRYESRDLYRESDYEIVRGSGLVLHSLFNGDKIVVVRECKVALEQYILSVRDFSSIESLIQQMGAITKSRLYKCYEIVVNPDINPEILTEENRSTLLKNTTFVKFRKRVMSAKQPYSAEKLLASALQVKFKSLHFYGESDINGRLGNRIMMKTAPCWRLISALMLREQRKRRQSNRTLTVLLEDLSQEYGTIELKAQNTLQSVKKQIYLKCKIPVQEQILVSGGYILTDDLADWSQYVKNKSKITVIWDQPNSFIVIPHGVFLDVSPTVVSQSCKRFQLAHLVSSTTNCRYSYNLLPTDSSLHSFLASFPPFLLSHHEDDLVISRGSLQDSLFAQKKEGCVIIIEIQNELCSVLSDLQGNDVVVAKKRHAMPSALLIQENPPVFSIETQLNSATCRFSMNPLDPLSGIVRKCERLRVIYSPSSPSY